MTTKVLWLTKGLGRGGAEALLVSTAAALARSDGWDIQAAYCLAYKNAMVAELEAARVTVHALGAPADRGIEWVGRLRRLLAREDFAIVHTHAPVPAAAVRLLVPRRTLLVHTEHNMWTRYRTPTRIANALTFGRNDAVIAVSQGVARSIRPVNWPGRTSPRAEVLIHGVDLSKPRPTRSDRVEALRRLGLPPEAQVVGTVGNLTPKKDHATMLQAFKRVADVLPAARLVIIGTGPLADELEAKAAHLSIADKVLFTGMRNDVPQVLPAFDVFVLTSLFEGLSIALVEAFAAEVPAVATAVGGVPEVVRPGLDGYLVPPRDPQRTAAKLIAILRDPIERDRLGRSAREGSARFDITRAAGRTEQIYRELLGGRP